MNHPKLVEIVVYTREFGINPEPFWYIVGRTPGDGFATWQYYVWSGSGWHEAEGNWCHAAGRYLDRWLAYSQAETLRAIEALR